jgi:hypothetical protein
VSRGVRAGEAGTGAGNGVVGGSYSGGGSSGEQNLFQNFLNSMADYAEGNYFAGKVCST